jgi:hypothetical protein
MGLKEMVIKRIDELDAELMRLLKEGRSNSSDIIKSIRTAKDHNRKILSRIRQREKGNYFEKEQGLFPPQRYIQ